MIVFCLGCQQASEIYVFKKYNDGLKNAKEESQNILLIFDFWGNPTLSAKRLVYNKAYEKILQDFTIIILHVDDPGQVGIENRKLQKTRYNSETQPMFYVLNQNGEIIKGPLGYCKEKEFENFIDFN